MAKLTILEEVSLHLCGQTLGEDVIARDGRETV